MKVVLKHDSFLRYCLLNIAKKIKYKCYFQVHITSSVFEAEVPDTFINH